MRGRLGRPLRIFAAVSGMALFVVTARYVALHPIEVRPAIWARWLITGALVHDLVVAPLAIVVGWLVVRFVPPSAKAPAQAGLIVSAVVIAMAWPALRGYGQIASNPTYLPRDYLTGLSLTLAVVWAACAGWAVARQARRRRTTPRGPAPGRPTVASMAQGRPHQRRRCS